MFSFEMRSPRRSPSLTPMIDVVFLLLVFFMLAARFGQETSLPLSAAGAASEYTGPPRIITLAGDDLALNGIALSSDALLARLPGLMTTPQDVIFVQPDRQTSLQHLVNLMDLLRDTGFENIAVVGQPG